VLEDDQYLQAQFLKEREMDTNRQLPETISVMTNTKVSDLKVGDLVITAEMHRVTGINSDGSVEVITVKPKCEYCVKHDCNCDHRHHMYVGWGQLGIAKVIEI
jgi:hypothetical protein